MNVGLELVDPKEYGIEVIKATQIEQSFLPKISEYQGYISIYNELLTEEITKELLVKATDLRKKLVKVRTGIKEVHATEKAFYLASGRYVDALKNKLTLPVEQMESKLAEIEDYFVNLEKQRLIQLQIDRFELLKPYEVENIENINLSTMEESVFESFVLGSKAKYEAKKESEKSRIESEKAEQAKQEAERLAKIEEQKRIIAENDKLKKEKDELEAKAKAEREKAAANLAAERKIANEKAIEESKKMKALQDELEAKAKAERAEKLRIEQAEELRLEQEAKEQKAPLKQKMTIWVESFNIGIAPIENDVTKDINAKFEAFKKWALTQITNH